MSKKTNKKETEMDVQPAYVKELLERGVAVVTGRSRGELDEKLAAIPCGFSAGPVSTYMSSGIYRVQINLNEYRYEEGHE